MSPVGAVWTATVAGARDGRTVLYVEGWTEPVGRGTYLIVDDGPSPDVEVLAQADGPVR